MTIMPKNDRLQRSALSYIFQLNFTVVTLAVAIFSTPRLIRWLGDEKLGIVRACSDWVGYLSLLELGLGGATVAILAGALHSGTAGRLQSAMAACLRAYRWVGLATIISGAFLVLVIPHLVFHSGKVASPLTADLRWAAALSVMGAALIIFSPLRAIWDVQQRGYVVSIILTVQSLVSTGVALLLAYYGYGVVGQAVAGVLGLLILYGTLVLMTFRSYPFLLRPSAIADVEQHMTLLKNLNRPTLALNLANRVSFLSDNLVIAYFFGPSMVVPFFVTQRLAQIAQAQLYTVGNATWAGLIQVRQVEGLELFNRRLLEITRLIVVLGLVLLVPIVAYDEAFVRRWVGEQQFGGTWLVALAAFNALLFSIPSFWGWVFNGAGLVAELVPVSLVGASVNVVVSVLATFLLGRWNLRLGLLGPVIGTATANVSVYLWWMPLLVHRNFETGLGSIFLAAARPLIVATPFAILLFELARRFPPRGWISLGAEMAAAAVVLLLLSWRFAMNSEERKMWAARFYSNVSSRFTKKTEPAAV